MPNRGGGLSVPESLLGVCADPPEAAAGIVGWRSASALSPLTVLFAALLNVVVCSLDKGFIP